MTGRMVPDDAYEDNDYLRRLWWDATLGYVIWECMAWIGRNRIWSGKVYIAAKRLVEVPLTMVSWTWV
jgi:hypothetical protein